MCDRVLFVSLCVLLFAVVCVCFVLGGVMACLLLFCIRVISLRICVPAVVCAAYSAPVVFQFSLFAFYVFVVGGLSLV